MLNACCQKLLNEIEDHGCAKCADNLVIEEAKVVEFQKFECPDCSLVFLISAEYLIFPLCPRCCIDCPRIDDVKFYDNVED